MAEKVSDFPLMVDVIEPTDTYHFIDESAGLNAGKQVQTARVHGKLLTLDDAIAEINQIYDSSISNQLSYKDPGGSVNVIVTTFQPGTITEGSLSGYAPALGVTANRVTAHGHNAGTLASGPGIDDSIFIGTNPGRNGTNADRPICIGTSCGQEANLQGFAGGGTRCGFQQTEIQFTGWGFEAGMLQTGERPSLFGSYSGKYQSGSRVLLLAEDSGIGQSGDNVAGGGENVLDHGRSTSAACWGNESGISVVGDRAVGIGRNSVSYQDGYDVCGLGDMACSKFVPNTSHQTISFDSGNVDTVNGIITIPGGHGLVGYNPDGNKPYLNLQYTQGTNTITGEFDGVQKVWQTGDKIQFEVVDATQLRWSGPEQPGKPVAALGTGHLLVPQIILTEITGVGNNSQPDADFQVLIGNDRTREAKCFGGYTVGELLDNEARNHMIYRSTDQGGALCYKDGTGTVQLFNLTPA